MTFRLEWAVSGHIPAQTPGSGGQAPGGARVRCLTVLGSCHSQTELLLTIQWEDRELTALDVTANVNNY